MELFPVPLNELAAELEQQLPLSFPPEIDQDELFARLQNTVQQLINADFERLIHLLYRMDVNEKQLRAELQNGTPNEAARIISKLICERQLKKIKTRQEFRRENHRTSMEDDEERW